MSGALILRILAVHGMQIYKLAENDPDKHWQLKYLELPSNWSRIPILGDPLSPDRDVTKVPVEFHHSHYP